MKQVPVNDIPYSCWFNFCDAIKPAPGKVLSWDDVKTCLRKKYDTNVIMPDICSTRNLYILEFPEETDYVRFVLEWR